MRRIAVGLPMNCLDCASSRRFAPFRGWGKRAPVTIHYIMSKTRRSDFDVTNSVQVSSPPAVLAAVEALFRPTWPQLSTRAPGARVRALRAAVRRRGRRLSRRRHRLSRPPAHPRHNARARAPARGLRAAARAGARSASAVRVPPSASSPGCSTMSATCAAADDRDSRNGAEFTRTHVSRGARFLEEYLPVLGFADWVPSPPRSFTSPATKCPLRASRSRSPSHAT